jgi:hypothetical protein
MIGSEGPGLGGLGGLPSFPRIQSHILPPPDNSANSSIVISLACLFIFCPLLKVDLVNSSKAIVM